MDTKFVFYTLLAMLLLTNTVLSQSSNTNFFYGRGQKSFFTTVKDKILLKLKNKSHPDEARRLFNNREVQSIEKMPAQMQGFIKIKLQADQNSTDIISRLKKEPDVEFVNPVFLNNSGSEIYFNNEFVVRFKETVSEAQIAMLNSEYGVEIKSVRRDIGSVYTFLIVKKTNLSVFQVAQKYYELLDCEWSMPDFYGGFHKLGTPNDPYFSNQYYAQNISAPKAWDISKGSSSIIIAVIDDGLSVHEDLPLTRLVGGYDYLAFDSDPSPDGNESHGISCAGIIAASSDNGLGIAGIAPNCKVMGIKIFGGGGLSASATTIAAAIDFARINGARVINNSWGGFSDDVVPPIVDAINRALSAGIVVSCAAGNTSNPTTGIIGSVEFPASMNGVFSVSAIDRYNNLQTYSPQRGRIDIVAPSGGSSSTERDIRCGDNDPSQHNRVYLLGDVWTTDVQGLPGYSPGNYNVCSNGESTGFTEFTPQSSSNANYTGNFGGTSAAAPQVAGVAALILSINPNLSYTQVRDIILNSTDRLWAVSYPSPLYGYGRLNAYKALKYTLENYGGTLTQSITIPSGESWNFGAVTIKLAPNINITVQQGGSMTATGTRFEPQTPGQRWGTVYLYGNNNSFYNCIFDGGAGNVPVSATQMVYVASTGNTFSGCTFRNSIDRGITGDFTPQGTRSAFNLFNCTFENSYVGMINLNANTYYIDNCTFQNNDNTAIFNFGNATISEMGYTKIINNSRIVGDAAVINYGTMGMIAYSNNGYNVVKNNRGVELYNAGYLNVSVPWAQANSTIRDDINGFAYSYIRNQNGYFTVPARGVWWGGTPQAGMFEGPVDYSNPLSSNPTGYSASPDGNLAMSSIILPNASVASSAGFSTPSPNADARTTRNAWLKQRMIALRDDLRKNVDDEQSARKLTELYGWMSYDRQNETDERAATLPIFTEFENNLKVARSGNRRASSATQASGETAMLCNLKLAD
jgi:subtilisin family serine protease